MPGGSREGERDRDKERSRDSRERRYRDCKSKDLKHRRSPDYYSSDEDAYDKRRGSGDDRRRRDRDKYRERSRSREDRDQGFGYDEYDDYDERERRYNRNEEAPNSTVMIRGLASHVKEKDIINKLSEYDLKAKYIRLMRKKETGASRGFAFVEFSSVMEAIQWKDVTQGVLNFDDTRATLHYSIPKDSFGSDRNAIQKYDWSCYKCGVNNFKRREQCFKCGAPREDSFVNENGNEVSLNPTNCLLLRNLSSITTEERVLTILGGLTSFPIKSIRIPKDTVYGVSKGVCFVELHTTLEASQLFTLLSSLNNGFVIDNCPVTVCYAKRNPTGVNHSANASNVASFALAAAQWTNQSETQSSSMVPVASTYESNTNDTVSVNGVIYPKYPPPDTRNYQYDEATNFYFDSTTGLYYDPNSHYYYNAATQSYLYWSEENSTYLPAQKSSEAVEDKKEKEKPKEKAEKSDKADKVKIAKKIAKDMEKWAKTLNQKKDIAKYVQNTAPVEISSSPSPSLVKYSRPSEIFERSDLKIMLKKQENEEKFAERPDLEDSPQCSPINDPVMILRAEEEKLTDWTKLLCLLCKRQFTSKEQLSKHQQASDLHKTNMLKMTKVKLSEEQISELSRNESGYRDRAKERRQKFGKQTTPEPNRFRDKYMEEYDSINYNPQPCSSGGGVGRKMMKAMGWTEGQGLGRSNQGRSSIIEVERRASGVGFGIRSSSMPNAGETYKDAVKRAMQQRFKELSEND